MNFLSLNHIAQNAHAVIARFPLAVLSAIVGTLSAISLIQFDDLIEHDEPFFNIIMTTVLGTLLFTALTLFLERAKFTRSKEMTFSFLALAFLVGYYLLLPRDFDYESAEFVIRFILFGLAFLFSITFAPFILNRTEVNGFWQHNKTLFIRLFFTFVYSLVLFLGLVLALISMDKLLGVNVADETYGKLAIFIVGFVSIPFLLSGVPQELDKLEKATDYPKGIKIFSQYILLPLLLIYATILYIYTGKIMVNWDWPEGMVSYLIIVFALGGMLTYLLFFPMMPQKSSHIQGGASKKSASREQLPMWLGWFSKGIYVLILPMTAVFFLALRIRIIEYGLTEMRYYGLVLCAWFVIMSLYFIFSKKKNIILFTFSLFVIVLISSFGPWGAISVAEKSQMNRLEEALTRNGLLVDGKVVKADEAKAKGILRADVVAISSTLDYLYRFHGFQAIQPWFSEDIVRSKRNDVCYTNKCCYGGQCVMDLLGLSYIDAWERSPDALDPDQPFNVSLDMKGDAMMIPVEGYRFVVQFDVGSFRVFEFEQGDEGYGLSVTGSKLTVKKGDVLVEIIDLQPMIDRLRANAFHTASQEEMTIEQGGFKFIFTWLGDYKDPLAPSINAGGFLLIK